MSRFGITGHFR